MSCMRRIRSVSAVSARLNRSGKQIVAGDRFRLAAVGGRPLMEEVSVFACQYFFLEPAALLQQFSVRREQRFQPRHGQRGVETVINKGVDCCARQELQFSGIENPVEQLMFGCRSEEHTSEL